MLNTIDYLIIIIYLFTVLVVGLVVGKRENLEGFLVNNRKTKMFLLIFTIVSTGVGMGTFLGISSSAYQTGISYGITIILASIFGVLLIALFAPRIKNFGDKYGAHTLGDWFGIRYSKKNRLLVAIVILISYFFLTAMQFVGIAGIIKISTGIDFRIALIISSLITIIYTSAAGIKSDFYTDAVQFFVIVLTLIFVLIPLSLIKVGGLSFVNTLPKTYFDPFAFGGYSFFFGGIMFGAVAFLVGMEIWQRIYASTSASEARKAFLWSAVILVILNLPIILLGLMAIKVVPGLSTPDFALFELMRQILPTGFLGLGIAGILAAAMSTVDSMILVGSATILKDIHKSFINQNLSEKTMLRFGRIYTFIFGIFCLVVAYLLPNIIQLQIIGAAMLAILAPAVIGGFIWKKSTAQGSFWSILIGLIVTFGLYPVAPTLSFIPGTLTSVVLFIIVSKFTYKENK